MVLCGEREPGGCCRHGNWKPAWIGFTACPPSAMRLRPTMHKEPEARVTRVETPAFNAILRVGHREVRRGGFLFSRITGPGLYGFETPRLCPTVGSRVS